MARAMSKVWIRHIGSTPGGFKVNEDRLINLEAVCNRFLLDLSARLTISGTPVQIINGMSDVTLDDILEEATEGEDGATKRSALTIREISFLTFRYCDDQMGAIRMATLFVDGVFDLQELCNAFNLDPSGRLIVAGITVPFTDKGKSTLTARTIRELAQRNGPSKEDGLSNATAFSVQGSPAKARPRNSTLSWPYGLREKYPDAGAVQISNKLVYVVTTSLGQQRVVKFVREYGIDAHKQWETAGYAPEHTIQEFPGGWKMVDMECLTRVDGWHLMFDLDPKGRRRVTADYNLEQVPPWAEIQTAVWEALMTLQRLQPVMVHGDLRLNNIMYNIRTGRVCFLDFDWAGPDESVRYPLLINSGVDWPPGVAANAEIKAIHDRELLKRELGIQN